MGGAGALTIVLMSIPCCRRSHVVHVFSRALTTSHVEQVLSRPELMSILRNDPLYAVLQVPAPLAAPQPPASASTAGKSGTVGGMHPAVPSIGSDEMEAYFIGSRPSLLLTARLVYLNASLFNRFAPLPAAQCRGSDGF